MRSAVLFIVGIAVGLAVQSGIAQNQNRGIVGLNHVALSVPNLDEAVAYYTKTMGFPEAFRSKDEKGQTTLVYVQISKNTFVELQPGESSETGGYQSPRAARRKHEFGSRDVQAARRQCDRASGERHESGSGKHHRFERQSYRACRASGGIVAPSGNGTLEVANYLPVARIFAAVVQF
jgi:catechol 2,3-dioxygenase-like lactoylglutathione lyase family enzyme